MKALTYEQLLLLDLAQIEEAFPLGAMEFKGRFRPAVKGEKPNKTLAKLLKAKRATKEHTRYPVATSPQRLEWDEEKERWVPKDFTPDEEHGYTSDPRRALDRDPKVGAIDALDEVTQARYSAEARNRQAQREQSDNLEGLARDDVRRVSAALKAFVVHSVRSGVDPTPFLVEMQRRLKEEQAKLKEAA